MYGVRLPDDLDLQGKESLFVPHRPVLTGRHSDGFYQNSFLRPRSLDNLRTICVKL